MSNPTKITKDDKGREWTYDTKQVLRIMSVRHGRVKVKDVVEARLMPDTMSVERLEMLFACGRAEWGDCVDDDGDSVWEAGW
jgi:hypothetical protein